MKRLMILRHAKSDWNAGASSDHARPLNRRGTAAAMKMGRVLAEIGEEPDLIYTSSAQRARETTMLAADAGKWQSKVVEHDELYGTSAGAALKLAATASDQVERLMLVGHEPTWSYLVHSVTGASVAMKTATVAGIELQIREWEQLPDAMGRLAYLLQPRLFENWEF